MYIKVQFTLPRHVILFLAYCSFEEEACMHDRRIIKRLCCRCCGNHPFLPEMIRHCSCQFHFEFLFLSFLFFFASLTKQIGPFSSFRSSKRKPASLKSIQIRPFVIFFPRKFLLLIFNYDESKSN